VISLVNNYCQHLLTFTKDVAMDCATLRQAIIFGLRIDCGSQLLVHLGGSPEEWHCTFRK